MRRGDDDLISARAWLFLVLLLVPGLVGCSPPDDATLQQCRQSAATRGKGFNLTPADLGELVEECMSGRGFILKRNTDTCQHDQRSALNRTCYYPDNLPNRLIYRFDD